VRIVVAAALAVVLLILGFFVVRACSPEVPEGPPVEISVPDGANFREVVDTLHARGLVSRPRVFRLYARVKGDDRRVRSGQYSFPRGAAWSRILEDLTVGRVLTEALTIPEGFTLKQMAPRIAAITEETEDSVLHRLSDESAATTLGLPGPGLEGYLFPDTYRFAQGAPFDQVLGALSGRYRAVWDSLSALVGDSQSGVPQDSLQGTAEDGLPLTEREVITLASIVQAEARLLEEMPVIASVYHNRLRLGIPLQADPTVLYALGGGRDRLLYAAMDSVADHPYNTYTHPGLPPGPIGAPGKAAIQAALAPAETDFLYFVARTDGTHIFSRTLAEHNRAVAQIRGEWERYRREQREREQGGGSV
jgi:UPF0755 protein